MRSALRVDLRATVAMLLACTLGACASEVTSDAVAGPGVTVRDSAGIRIVENHDSAWTEETRWRLADEPDLVIGSFDGGVPGTDLTSVGDVLVVDDRIVVEDIRLRELRVFSSEGVFERTLGGQGDGPLEFARMPVAAAIGGDSVAVFDPTHRKVVVFPAEGGAGVSTSTVDSDWDGGRRWTGVAFATDGALVMYDAPYPDPDTLQPGRHVLHASVHLFDRDGRPVRPLGELPARFIHVDDDRSFRAVSMAPSPTFHVADGHLVHSFPLVSAEITTIDLESGVRGIIRLPFPARPSPADLQETIASALFEGLSQGVSGDALDLARERAESEQVVDTLSPFRTHLLADDGHHWLRLQVDLSDLDANEYLGAWSAPGGDWAVLAPDGRWLGTVSIPEGLNVRHVGSDFVLGTRTDDLGIPWIERWPILKPQ